ncbi:MAG: molybdenum cofactor guanylyltransferase [Parasulfuritortus sp.]|jgi:molybdopterin-guanine dinucleotide biosynthesis protein A|nr:molybdenum cofactor guanylyltransferase [Parasulfuritortus sp.]
MKPEPTIGVVLAGGLSSRMGQDKALLPWAEGSLLDHMINLLKDSGLETVVVCGERPGYPSFVDPEPGQGPGVAISHYLASLTPDAWALVVPVDMPMLTAKLIRRLLGEPGKPRRAAYYADYPLPALLPARDGAGKIFHGHSLRALHFAAGSRPLPLDAEDTAAFMNVNTPDDWDRAQEVSEK